MTEFPHKGKMVIAAPADAVLLHDANDDGDFHVYTAPTIPEGTVYVIDLDEMYRNWNKEDQ